MLQLQIETIHKSFPLCHKPVLHGVSLALEAGDFCILVGSNGSGKSTLLKIILGEHVPDQGRILLEGQDITALPVHQRTHKISAVSQDIARGTLSELTLLENLSLAQMRGRDARYRPYKAQRPLFKNVLSPLNLGLENQLDTPIGALSGGQRQAVAMVMALLDPPKLLLLDEHCSALDPKTTHTVMNTTLQALNTLHITTIMVTHNLCDAIHYGNRLIMLHQGKIVFDVRDPEKENLTTEGLLTRFHNHEDCLLTGQEGVCND